MSDTANEPAEPIDGGAAVEIPAQWEGMTDTEKDVAVDDMLTDVAERAGIEGTAADEDDAENGDDEAPRRFVDPDSVTD